MMTVSQCVLSVNHALVRILRPATRRSDSIKNGIVPHPYLSVHSVGILLREKKALSPMWSAIHTSRLISKCENQLVDAAKSAHGALCKG